jgi:hypothetical protein
MGLLAATLGVDGTTVRAGVRVEAGEVDDRTEYRVVLQTYDGPMTGARPVGSTQRVVTGAELRKGLQMSVLELRTTPKRAGGKELVVAWIEEGAEELELDARIARPHANSLVGVVRKGPGDAPVAVTLRRSQSRARRLAA